MMKTNKKLQAVLFAALTACTMFRAVPVSAETLEVDPQNYVLDESCVNIVPVKYKVWDPRVTGFKAENYTVRLWNVKEGISDLQITLFVPEELKIIRNDDDEPASALCSEYCGGTASAVLDEEKNELQFTFHSDEPVSEIDPLFILSFYLPVNLSGGTYPIKAEVNKLSGPSGDIAYNTVDGYIKVFASHDDMKFEKGDMNFSRYVDVGDAQRILKEYVKTLSGCASSLRDDHKQIADINEDGTVDVLDAQLLLKYCTEQTALNEVTWKDILKKEPVYPAVHISNETYNIVRHIGIEAS